MLSSGRDSNIHLLSLFRPLSLCHSSVMKELNLLTVQQGITLVNYIERIMLTGLNK